MDAITRAQFESAEQELANEIALLACITQMRAYAELLNRRLFGQRKPEHEGCHACDDLSPMETELLRQGRYFREVWNSGVEMDFVDRLQCAIENDPRVRWANDAIVD